MPLDLEPILDLEPLDEIEGDSEAKRRSRRRSELMQEQQRLREESERTTAAELGGAVVPSFVGGLETAAEQLGGAMSGLARAYEDIPFLPPTLLSAPPIRRLASEQGQLLREFWGGKAEKQAQEVAGLDLGPGGQTVADVARMAGTTAPAFPAATLGLPAALGTAAAQGFGGTFTEATKAFQERGATPEEAERLALAPAAISGAITGAITGAFGRTGIESLAARDLVRRMGESNFRRVAKSAIKNYFSEAGEEGLDQAVQSLVEVASYNPDLTLDQAIQNTLMAAGGGGALGFTAGAITAASPEASAAIRERRALEEEIARGEVLSPEQLAMADLAARNLTMPGTVRESEQQAWVAPMPEAPPEITQFQGPIFTRRGAFTGQLQPVRISDRPVPQETPLPPKVERETRGKVSFGAEAPTLLRTAPEIRRAEEVGLTRSAEAARETAIAPPPPPPPETAPEPSEEPQEAPTETVPAPGRIRLYQGKGPTSGGGSDWTSDIQRAATFGPEISYVDVTPEEAARMKTVGSDYRLPIEVMRRAKVMPQQVQQQVYDLEAELEGGQSASEIGEATEVYGDVPAQPVEGTGQVPAEEGRPGVRAEAQAPEQVLLSPEQQTAAKESLFRQASAETGAPEQSLLTRAAQATGAEFTGMPEWKEPGGLTGAAMRVGATIRTRQQLEDVRAKRAAAEIEFREAVAKEDFDAMQGAGMKRQFFNEVIESAVGIKTPQQKAALTQEEYERRMQSLEPSTAEGGERVAKEERQTQGQDVLTTPTPGAATDTPKEPPSPVVSPTILPAKIKALPPNAAFVQVINWSGETVGYVAVPYDGTPEGAVKALEQAQAVASENFEWKVEYYNTNSRNGATDENGKLKWVISPNRKYLAEPSTSEARYILGDLSAAPREPESLPPPETPPSQTLGIVPAGVADLIPGWERIKRLFRRKGTASRGLPEPAYAAEQVMRGQISRGEKSIKQTARDLKRALAKAYGLTTREQAMDDYRRIPASQRQAMDAYLKGGPGEGIPPDVRGILDNMRAEVSGLSQQIISELERTEGNEKLIETIRNNLDVYLNRSYRFFDSKRPAEEWYNSLPPDIRNRAEQFVIAGEIARGGSLTPEQARSILLNWLSDLKDGRALRSAKLGSKDLSQFMKRKTIAPEIRAVLGEYADPLINYARSVSKMTDWLANQQFLSRVREAGLGQWLFTETDAPPGFNTRIAAEGSQTMSPLDGLRTSPEIAEVFNEFTGAPKDYGVVVRTYLRLNALTKQAATTQSLLTQMRNLASQPWFWGMSGHWRLGNLAPTLKAVAEDLGVTKGSPGSRWREYLKDAAAYGIVGDTARATELKEIVRDAALSDVTPEGLGDFSIAKLIKRFGYRIPAEVYKLSDELGKIYGWENEKALVRRVHPEWTETQVKQEAANRVRDLYPTYSKVPTWVKSMRNLPVGPFVSFPYEILRTSLKAIGRSATEIRSSNPVERQIGIKRAVSQAATLGSGFALAALSRAIWGITQQEEDDLRRFQPPWAKNSQFLYLGRQDDGKLRFLNLSYQNPYSYLVDPVIAGIASATSEEPLLEATARTTAEFFRPYISEQMLANALLDVSRNKTENGREVYNPQDDLGTKMSKVLDHVGMTLAPGTAQRARKRIVPSFTDNQPEFGRQLSPGVEVAAELTGLRLEQFDFKNGLGYKARAFSRDAEDAEGIFRSLAARRTNVSQEELADAFRTAQERRFQLWSNLRKDYLSALRSGVQPLEAAKILESMGLSKKMSASIYNGSYKAWLPGPETIQRMRELKRDLTPAQMLEIARDYEGRTVEP